MASPAHSSIPIVDFGPFISPGASQEERSQVAGEIFRAFTLHGFVYIKNHGVDKSTVKTAFDHSANFFDTVTDEERKSLAWTGPAGNRGFSRLGLERVSHVEEAANVAALRESAPDIKESFEIGREGVPEYPNQWPTDKPQFKTDMLAFYDQCALLHRELMRAIALGLGMEETWFDPFTRLNDNTLRLLHYPAVPAATLARASGTRQARAGAHTDFGSLTLLFQDSVGGLQIQGPDRASWIDATPIPGTIVVNAADLLARWTNDVVRSTAHRVVEPARDPVDGPDGPYHPARYSVVYFCNPDFDRFIDVVPGTLAPGAEKKYEGVNSGDYLVYRLSATY